MEKLQDKRTMIIFLLVVLGVVIFLWLVLPSHITISVPQMQEQEQYEAFDANAEQVNAEMAGKEEQVSKQVVSADAPFIDAKTGTLIDGPGYEKGEMEGAGQDVLSTIRSNYYMLDDGANGEFGLQNGLFSKQCCSEQWPTPFKAGKYDPYVCANKKNGNSTGITNNGNGEVEIDGNTYTTSSYFGNNSFNDAGLTKLMDRDSQAL